MKKTDIHNDPQAFPLDKRVFAFFLKDDESPVRWFSLVSALLFAALQALLGMGRQRTAEYVGVAQHLLLFPVVAAFPAPAWARAAGYGWLIVDTTVSGATLAGLDAEQAFSIRLGGHLLMGTWIAASSVKMGGWPARVGLPLGLGTAGYTLVSSRVDRKALYALGPLMVIWLLLLAFRKKA